jgi:ABC-type multidrug transport system fused ATPase/permease subunit
MTIFSDVDSLDHKTDTAIQTSLQHELGRDTTVITIAHRLQTIMDADKIVSLVDPVSPYSS